MKTLALSLLLFTTGAFAQGTYITQLPPTTPEGPEFIAVAQPAAYCGGITVYNGYCGAYITPLQLKTYIGAGVGTITGITFTLPSSFMSPSGSPCTGPACPFTFTLATATANYVWAGPTTGSAATPTYRALVSADIPANASNTSGTAGGLSGSQSQNYFYAGPCSGGPGAGSWRVICAADLPLFSGLSAASTLVGPECVPITQSGANVCTTISLISAFILANISTVAYSGLPAGTVINGKNDLIANASAANADLEKVAPNLFKWRSTTLTSATTITANCDLYDVEAMDMTAGSGTLTIANPSCTPVMGQQLLILLQTTNTQTMAYGMNVTQGTCLSTSSGSSKSDWFKLKYDGLQSKWECTPDGSNL